MSHNYGLVKPMLHYPAPPIWAPDTPFGSEAARPFASVASGRRLTEHFVARTDCQIPAITQARGKANASHSKA